MLSHVVKLVIDNSRFPGSTLLHSNGAHTIIILES